MKAGLAVPGLDAMKTLYFALLLLAYTAKSRNVYIEPRHHSEQVTLTADTLLRDLRHERFHRNTLEILDNHPIVRDAERGNLGMDALERFVGEQYYMIKSDLRSLAHLYSRYADGDNGEFFRTLLRSETISLNLLLRLGRRLGLSETLIKRHEPRPGGQAYPSYLARLSHYGEDIEVAAAFAITFPTWRIITSKLRKFLHNNYGFSEEEVAFLNYFSSPQPGFEEAARRVIELGLRRGIEYDTIARSVRLMEGYQVMFWDSVYRGISSLPGGL